MWTRSSRLVALVLVVGLFSAAVFAWVALGARRQREALRDALVSQADVLARSLGPGLAAASGAAREIDETLTWRLLDVARLTAALDDASPLDRDALGEILDASGLDGLAVYDTPGGAPRFAQGDVPASLAAVVGDLLASRNDEAILAPDEAHGDEHVSVGVRGARSVVVARAHRTASRTFAAQVGLTTLLERLVTVPGVLYLEYRETETGPPLAATWDAGPVPVPPAETALRSLPVFRARDRDVFEVVVPVEAPGAQAALLRVGLDGGPLLSASAQGMRGMMLFGVVLAILAIGALATGLVLRQNALHRERLALDLAASEAARQQSERLAAAGALAAGLSHEVRSPLNAIGLAAQRLARRLAADADAAALAMQIRGEVTRLDGVVHAFLDLARPIAVLQPGVDLHAVAREAVSLLEHEAAAAGVALTLDGARTIVVGDPQALHRALVNLVRNAVQASPPGTSVEIDVRAEGEGQAAVRVADRGRGLEPGMEERAFEPFQTTRADGTGLGLALVRRVAEEHGGRAALRARPDGGAIATLTLPLEGERGDAS